MYLTLVGGDTDIFCSCYFFIVFLKDISVVKTLTKRSDIIRSISHDNLIATGLELKTGSARDLKKT